ncbi:zinc-binding dehydrogenase [Nocardiopsis sp. JB363]|uniref:zinc-binding dehydrogenase n=1 Tax=Nocardiopsis sp. JB363 TaxID=1434837 RepID=UPI001F3BED73|nr:zinc-binding dehydrogenase [Nocardiopsis sp. JB363]
MDFTTAASLGCRFATAYRALIGRARLSEGEWVTVLGAGGVGLSSVVIARALGARVIAVDRNAEALAAARELGAEHVLVADGTDVPAAVRELTGGGSHVSVDAVGSEQTCSDAVFGLRRRGRHVQVGLLPPVEDHPRVPMDRVFGWELDLLGSHGMVATDYPGMMESVERGVLRPQLLIERVIGLDEAAALLPGFDQATVAGMTVIDPSGGLPAQHRDWATESGRVRQHRPGQLSPPCRPGSCARPHAQPHGKRTRPTSPDTDHPRPAPTPARSTNSYAHDTATADNHSPTPSKNQPPGTRTA